MKKRTVQAIGLLAVMGLLYAGMDTEAASTRDLVRPTAGFDRVFAEALAEETASARETEQEKDTKEAKNASETEEIQDAEIIETAEAQKDANSVDNLWGYTNLGIAQVDNHLNVRDKAGEDGELVGKMTKNAACEILKVEGEWAYVKSGKVEGYVHTDYLLTGEEAKERAQEVVYTVAKVNTQTLKVREQPSTECPVITLVAQDERLEVVEQKPEGWAKIMLDDEEAYVSTDYCVIEEELDTAVTMKELMYGNGISNTRIDLCQFAKQFVGNPYVWGGTSLTKGADCSGFVQSVFRQFGVSLPRSSREQVNVGTKISLADAQPGDLIFYAKGGTINHVALYIGNGQVVHASSPKTGIRISNATYRTPAAVKRVLS
ncbi:NlpC/P60 family protein [Lachnospiraceae bacterium JLR.KK008]